MLKRLTPLLLIVLWGCQGVSTPVVTDKIQEDNVIKSSQDNKLQDIIAKAWQLQLERDPQLAAAFGDSSQAGKLADLSPATLLSHNQRAQALAQQLAKIDTSLLSKTNKTNALILKYQLDNEIDLYRYHDHYLPLTAESGFHADISAITRGRFTSMQDYRDYLSRLSALPKYFSQQTYWLKKGIKSGITQPRLVLKGFENSISAFIVPVEQSVYYQPFNDFPAHFTEAEKRALIAEANHTIETKVLPLYQDFYRFMTESYIPQARRDIAASSLPFGNAFYTNRLKHYTTVDMSADEVHDLGLSEVKRIRAQMQQIVTDLKFKGTFADFLHFLRTDPQFYAKTPKALLKEAAYLAKQADAILPKYFGKLPRSPYGVEAVPAEIAPKYTTGRYSGANSDYEPGYYWVNTYALETRPLYELPALTLHEAVPGHHLQISLNKEIADLPNFRRYSYISAFGEGWGLYSEYLGIEAGYYQDPYSQFGRLTYEMWRAARLVVDTGMHVKGWSRQQAIDFMASNTALSLHNVTTEIDRYISWPGQALSYKIGELTIKRLRAKAEQALGEQFDIRQFHDAVLEQGSVPMSVLEQQIDELIQTTQAKMKHKAANMNGE
jgi:uncharacterized protein (DUF885 family)